MNTMSRVKLLASVEALDASEHEGKVVVVCASAVWCGPCKAVKPHYERLSVDFPDAYFYKFDVEDQPDLSQLFEIEAMPTFVLMQDKKVVKKYKGADLMPIRHELTNMFVDLI
jgi:thioredoxin 1